MITSKFSLAHLSLIDETIFNLIKIAHQASYEYVSPRLRSVTQEEEKYRLVGDKHAITECQKILADSRVKVLDVELLVIEDDTDIRTEFFPILDTAAQIGAKYAIAQVHSTNLNVSLDKFRQICEFASQYNISVVVEMIPWSSLADVQTTNKFVRDAQCENSGILLDLLHLYRTRTDPNELKAIDQKHLHFVHLCDAKGKGIKSFKGQKHIAREARYPAGRGDIAILNYLDNISCEIFSLEIPNKRLHRHLGSLRFAEYILQDTKNYLILEECWRVRSKYRSVPDRLI